MMENGAVLLEEASRKTVLTAWQERKREEIEHPFLKERAPLQQQAVVRGGRLDDDRRYAVPFGCKERLQRLFVIERQHTSCSDERRRHAG